jgi:type VI secretion system ImpM family protein
VNETGCFGKVPAHGDFVWQGLPAKFVTPWDNWLQEQLLSLQERRPQDWLDLYLCGPIWRFVIRDESLGHTTWGGIISPSVDIVGRYFPFTIASPLPHHAPIVYSARKLSSWQAHAEDIMLTALTDTLSVEDILARVRAFEQVEVGEKVSVDTGTALSGWGGRVAANESWSEQLLEELICNSFEYPCYWSRLDADSGETTYQVTDGFRGFEHLFTE